MGLLLFVWDFRVLLDSEYRVRGPGLCRSPALIGELECLNDYTRELLGDTSEMGK